MTSTMKVSAKVATIGSALATRGIDALGRSVLASKWDLVSPGVVTLTNGQLGFQKGLLVWDPDGHAVQLIEK